DAAGATVAVGLRRLTPVTGGRYEHAALPSARAPGVRTCSGDHDRTCGLAAADPDFRSQAGSDGRAPRHQCKACGPTGRTAPAWAVVGRKCRARGRHFGAYQCPPGGRAHGRRADGTPRAALTTGARRAPLMAGVRKKPQSSGRYQAWFIDMAGKRTYFVG